MEVSSVQKLCIELISAAFQRCRVAEDLCRLSVVLKSSDSSIVRISISDTGIGSCLEEFQDLKFSRRIFDAEKWDIYDDKIYHYHLNLRESKSNRRLTRLPSNPKNGAKFSGSEVYLSTCENVADLLSEVNHFFRKTSRSRNSEYAPTFMANIFCSILHRTYQPLLLVLKIPNVGIELVAEEGDTPRSRCENVFLANECNPLALSASNVERLKSGLQDYVLKHGNSLHRKCDSCFPSWEHLKVGSGIACSTESHRTARLLMETVIVISEIAETTPCLRSLSAETEVVCFNDFSPCSVYQSSLTALTAIDWKSYGLVLGRVVDQGGYTVLEWENLPPNVHIDMALHCYHEHEQIKWPPLRKKSQPGRNLIKKAIKLALDDLKKKHAGMLLSAHALKICSYAPDLARTIAGLIISSNDSEFRGECLSVLGLQSQDIGGKHVEACIEEKIISVIEMNDGKPQRSKEAAAFLFVDDCLQERNFQDEEHDSGDYMFSSLDF